MDDAERQALEVEALQSIYNEEEFDNNKNSEGLLCMNFYAFHQLHGNFTVTFVDNQDDKVDGGTEIISGNSSVGRNLDNLIVNHLPPIELSLTLPKDYPSQSPPRFTVSCSWMKIDMLIKVCKELDNIWINNESSEVLYLWMQFVKEDLFTFLELDKELHINVNDFKSEKVLVNNSTKKNDNKINCNNDIVKKADEVENSKKIELRDSSPIKNIPTSDVKEINNVDKNNINYDENSIVDKVQDQNYRASCSKMPEVFSNNNIGKNNAQFYGSRSFYNKPNQGYDNFKKNYSKYNYHNRNFNYKSTRGNYKYGDNNYYGGSNCKQNSSMSSCSSNYNNKKEYNNNYKSRYKKNNNGDFKNFNKFNKNNTVDNKAAEICDNTRNNIIDVNSLQVNGDMVNMNKVVKEEKTSSNVLETLWGNVVIYNKNDNSNCGTTDSMQIVDDISDSNKSVSKSNSLNYVDGESDASKTSGEMYKLVLSNNKSELCESDSTSGHKVNNSCKISKSNSDINVIHSTLLLGNNKCIESDITEEMYLCNINEKTDINCNNDNIVSNVGNTESKSNVNSDVAASCSNNNNNVLIYEVQLKDKRIKKSVSHYVFNNFITLLKNYNEDRILTEFRRAYFCCNICFQDKTGLQCTQFKPCDHTFCKECIGQYLQVRIKEGDVFVIKCPENKCNSDIMPSQVRDVVGPEQFAKYDNLLLMTTLEAMTDIITCPRITCQYPVSREPDEKMALCPACNYVFCVYCKMVYHGIEPCRLRSDEKAALVKQYMESTEVVKRQMEHRYGAKQLKMLVQTSLSESWIDENNRNCPHCSASIEKSGGCNKMVCWRCSTFFCWTCGSRLDPTLPYKHYLDPKSRCHNQLFEGADAISDDEDFLVFEDDDDDDDVDVDVDVVEEDIVFELVEVPDEVLMQEVL